MKTNKSFSLFLAFLISSSTLMNLSPAWGGKEEDDIDCEEQIFSEPSLNRKIVHISRYTPDTEVSENSPSLMFLHGGPGIVNEGQFDQFISEFTNLGFRVYVPEIIGSGYYQDAAQMDANEYKQNYRTDIQAVIDHMNLDSPGKKYAISHSLGCHQLLRFLSHDESRFNFEAVTAIAGPWDLGANKLYSMAKNWRTDYKSKEQTIKGNIVRSYVGVYAKLEEGEKPMTTSYNVTVDMELNKRFSVLYQESQFGKLPPVQLIHAQDDKLVNFSLSLKMFEALKARDNNVAGYFISTGDHGFIKNPLDSSATDTLTETRQSAVKNILDFFANPQARNGSILFDGQEVAEISSLPIEYDALKEHETFLKEYHK